MTNGYLKLEQTVSHERGDWTTRDLTIIRDGSHLYIGLSTDDNGEPVYTVTRVTVDFIRTALARGGTWRHDFHGLTGSFPTNITPHDWGPEIDSQFSITVGRDLTEIWGVTATGFTLTGSETPAESVAFRLGTADFRAHTELLLQ